MKTIGFLEVRDVENKWLDRVQNPLEEKICVFLCNFCSAWTRNLVGELFRPVIVSNEEKNIQKITRNSNVLFTSKPALKKIHP